ncbi:hypothetical protein Sjap_012437 [Stephania japonica]|uniref:RRM domain-containing protein n=1 Tax=Stephania japonica TaxID=461633 RepID=A0AAP0IX62_9MAGN
MAQNNGKLMPNLDQESTKLLNLTVLQRIDPFVEEILITAAHVTFYAFNIDHSEWSRKDVEGSLFVVKRNTQPRFQFIVMNRRNTDNLVENILGDFEYEVQVPYLLYRNAAQEVNGIWFYNPRECEEVGNLFTRILNAYSKVPPNPKVSSTKSDYDELEAVPNIAVMDGPLEPPSSTTSAITDVPEDTSFVNFFSTAMNFGNASNVTTQGQLYQPTSSVPSTSRVSTVLASPLPAMQIPSAPPRTLSNPSVPLLDTPETNISNNRVTNLIKPSVFLAPPSSSALMMPPTSSSLPTAPPLHPPVTLHRPYGAPLLQPFPPPSPSPSLTPAPTSSPNYAVITREKVREALLRVVKFVIRKFRIASHGETDKASTIQSQIHTSLAALSIFRALMAAFRGIARELLRNPRSPSQLVFNRGISSKLFVGGLSFYTTEKYLAEAFSQFGQVVEAKIVMDRVSDRSKGFGFVTFASEDEAQKAIEEMNGKVLNGRVVFVDTAKPTRFSERMPIARGPPEPFEVPQPTDQLDS